MTFVLGSMALALAGTVPHNGMKRNYLNDVLSQTQGVERQFLSAQQQRPDRRLLVNLGIIRMQRFHPEGSYQIPNGKWEPMATDDGESLAVNDRKRLRWNVAFDRGRDLRHVLIFVPSFESWPGLQPVTIVLTDGSFRVLS